MMMPSGSGITFSGPPQTITASSDDEGKFVFDKLEPGRYSLSGEKAGFGRQQYGSRTGGQFSPGSPLTLEPGQKMIEIEFKLLPQAVILGRVVDEDGEPVTGAMVQVMRQLPYARQPIGMMGASANDIGEFRIGNLAPGKYMIRVDYRSGMYGPVQTARVPEGQERRDYVSTYYPGVTDPSSAVPIEVTAGREVSGIEVRLQKARVYKVSGRVQGVATDPTARISVSLQPQKRSMGFSGGFGGGNVKPDGTFVLPSVQPGSYFLTLMSMGAGRPQSLARLPFTVTNGDVENIVLQAGQTLLITGRVIAETETPTKITGQVMLRGAEGFGFGSMPVRVAEDGTFKLEGVSRDKHEVVVMGIPDGMYVSSIRVGNHDVLEHGLDLSNVETAPSIEVRFSSKGATVQGVVLHEGKPAPGAMVTLLPQPFRPEEFMMSRKAAQSDQSGRFTISGIAPGEYRAYAFQEFIPIQMMEADELKVFEPFAVPLKLKQEAREQIELKLALPAK
jgi:hypothetical protein